MTEEIDGVRIEIIKKDVKRINIRIYPTGPVRVSAPRSMKKSEIMRFVLRQLDRIKKAQSRLFENQEAQRLVSKDTDGKIFLFGKPYELQFCSLPESGVFTESGKLIVSVTDNSDEARKTKLDCFLEAQLEKALLPLVSKWENITHLYCSEWKIKKVKSYWGKCKTSARSLTFNLNLVHLPEEQIEYVVLHELAHLKYPNHQKEFKAFLSEYMPDWKTRSAKLR